MTETLNWTEPLMLVDVEGREFRKAQVVHMAFKSRGKTTRLVVVKERYGTDAEDLVFAVLDNGAIEYSTDVIRNISTPPAYIPFTAETFPPLNQCELRNKSWGDKARAAVVYVSHSGAHWMFSDVEFKATSFEDLMRCCEIRINGGDWQPCGVLQK